jgi:hypothetical protein
MVIKDTLNMTRHKSNRNIILCKTINVLIKRILNIEFMGMLQFHKKKMHRKTQNLLDNILNSIFIHDVVVFITFDFFFCSLYQVLIVSDHLCILYVR